MNWHARHKWLIWAVTMIVLTSTLNRFGWVAIGYVILAAATMVIAEAADSRHP